MTFTPREDFLPRADCGVPGFKLEDHERIVGGVEARPHQFPWQVGLFFDGYFCGGSIICKPFFQIFYLFFNNVLDISLNCCILT